VVKALGKVRISCTPPWFRKFGQLSRGAAVTQMSRDVSQWAWRSPAKKRGLNPQHRRQCYKPATKQLLQDGLQGALAASRFADCRST